MTEGNTEMMLQSVATLTAWRAEPGSTAFMTETFTSLTEHGDVNEQLDHIIGLAHGMAQVAGLLLLDFERATSNPAHSWLQRVAATAEPLRTDE